MEGLGKNDPPPDDLQDNFDDLGGNDDNDFPVDNNHIPLEEGDQMNNESEPKNNEPMDTSHEDDVFSVDVPHNNDNNVDDIERTLEILDQTEDNNRQESVDEIEHTLEMLESSDREPANTETNQLENTLEDVLNEGDNENANDDRQMSFEEHNQDQDKSFDDKEHDKSFEEHFQDRDDEEQQNADEPDNSNPLQDAIEIDDNTEPGDNENADQDEDNEDQEDVQEIDDNEAEENAAVQETEENEDNEDNGTVHNLDDEDENQDSNENASNENDVDAEPMEVPDDEVQENSSEHVPEEKRQEDTSEHNDQEGHTEDVEHVQEPEESDVCLIPDDEENEVTDAEREKARQVREDADKEDEEQEKEKVQEKEAEAETEDTEEQSAATNESNINENQDQDDGNQQDLSTPTPTFNVEEPDSTERIIISTAVTTEQVCFQCNMTKNCSYRFKHAESGEYRYVCETECAQFLISSSNNKYFIRNKKFLLEEVDPKTTSENICIQCKESVKCKYFFKVDDEFYYICNNDCYNLLNMEEPDKYKIKRNSIRVRNIGATLNHGTPRKPAGSPSVDEPSSSRIVARTELEADVARIERNESFVRRCFECDQKIQLNAKLYLNWETYDFCNEICLGKYQRDFGSHCKTCGGEVSHQSMGKYSVRFGFDIRQFCKASCLNEFKKGLKTCSCCQKDISQDGEGFLAPVGDKDQFKDFCSQACMRKYDYICNPKKKLRVDKCAVCNIEKPIKVEMILDGKEHHFCTNPCFSAFKFVSNINADQCNMCSKYFERKNSDKYTIYTDNKRPKVFCCKICINVYIIVNRKIVSCQWCKVKKYNFDMIYRQFNNQEILMCSLNCLTLHTVSTSAVNRSVTKCDNCNATATPQYHLTMSDSSMRNFCKYQCVMKFQNQFGRTPLTLDNNEHKQQLAHESLHSTKHGAGSQKPFPTGLPKKVKPKQAATRQTAPKPIVKAKMPVISKVASLASFDDVIEERCTRSKPVASLASFDDVIEERTTRSKPGKSPKVVLPKVLPKILPKKAVSAPISSAPKKAVSAPLSSIISPPTTRKTRAAAVVSPVSPPPAPTPPPTKRKSTAASTAASAAAAAATKETVSIKSKIVTVPPIPKIVRNVQTMCKPATKSVAIDNTVECLDAQNQTEKDFSAKCLLPVPVPIYLPTPMHMYATPFPVPIPIPIPIPVPIFIPTTRNSAAGIMKEISKIQDKMPADPFEAELLMMAEMVADDKRQEESESDSEDTKPVLPSYSSTVNNSLDTNNFGDDVLQMALKMATSDYDEHPTSSVDLESAMHPSSITNPPPTMISHNEVGNDQMIMLENNRAGQRGKKRPPISTPITPQQIRTPIRAPAKRMRREPMSPNESEHQPQVLQQQQQQPQQPLEKPDANMCLKYTFGVNAWKQWVVTKNADMEKSSVRRRPFKTELLQMTADELNYSLCLFVKEVRKPNGTEYAPDTIYYLVLGIQQYLYENGRIDNIFTDPYYERFTDCLDEVSKKFSILYNDSQYIVTRVEEEHLWECKQLGAHSPHVLLSTLMFFNTKHFNLTTVEEHMQLSFSHIMKHWKRTPQNVKSPGARNVLLRFYPPQTGLDSNPRKKKVYEQQENEDNPLRCPVRLYEFYLSKCPESVKTRNDVFYLQPERSCVPDSPVWYSTQALSQESLQKMLHRVKMVKEINIALLTS